MTFIKTHRSYDGSIGSKKYIFHDLTFEGAVQHLHFLTILMEINILQLAEVIILLIIVYMPPIQK